MCFVRNRAPIYLGNVSHTEGIHPKDDKVRAVSKVPPPHNVHELRSVSRTHSLLSQLIAQTSTPLAPLLEMTRTNAQGGSGTRRNKSF